MRVVGKGWSRLENISLRCETKETRRIFKDTDLRSAGDLNLRFSPRDARNRKQWRSGERRKTREGEALVNLDEGYATLSKKVHQPEEGLDEKSRKTKG